MSTMRSPLQSILVTNVQHQGPWAIRILVTGQRRYYVRPMVDGRQRTVAICDSESEAQQAYQDFLVTRAWQAFDPVSPEQRERLNYYVRTVPGVLTVLNRVVRTFVQPIPTVSSQRIYHPIKRKKGVGR